MFSLSDKEKKQELKTQICKILFSGKIQFRLTQPSVILTEIVASKTIWEFPTDIWIRFLKFTFLLLWRLYYMSEKRVQQLILFNYFLRKMMYFGDFVNILVFFTNYRSTNNLLLA